MSVVVITPPQPIVSLDLAKRHLRVETTDDDDLIGLYIGAAQGEIDGPAGWLRRAIMPQTLELRLDGFYAGDWACSGGYAWEGGWTDWTRWPFGARIELPCPPLIDVLSVTYEDPAGADQVLTSAGWRATEEGLDPAFAAAWPSGRWQANAVRIRYRAGYVADPTASPLVAAPPSQIVAAALLGLGDLWANREASVIEAGRTSVVENPTAARLLSPFRIYRL